MNNLLLKLKISAAFFVLIVLTGSVYSQTIISTKSVSKNATLISKQIKETKTGSIILEKEPENWMSNKNYLDFSSTINYDILMENEKVVESSEIEDWMLDESEWVLSNFDMSDNEIYSIESWMLDKEFWKLNPEMEQNLIEDWMTNDKFWLMVN